MLYSDLSDSTLLASSGEPEDYFEILRYLRQRCQEIVPRHGGVILDFSGDGFLAMFGYPVSSELDGRHATEAALEVHDVMRRSPFRPPNGTASTLTLHSGIHSGLVLVIEDEQFPGRYTVAGEAPHLAARLSDQASRDQILVSAATFGGESQFFELRERGKLTLPGRTEPLATYQVLGLSRAATRYEARTLRGLTRFVGRRTAMDALEERLHEAAAGTMRIAYVAGAAGVGKTRLIHEFLGSRCTEEWTVHRGYCESTSAAQPLQPFKQILAHAAGSNASDKERPQVAATIAEVGAAIRKLASHRRTILFIDDWHWVDDATRQALSVLRTLEPSHLLVVIATRQLLPVDPGAQQTPPILLATLDDEDAGIAIRSLRPELDPFGVRHVQRLSGGNPLFIEELCHFASVDSLSRVGPAANAGLAWLDTVVESRVNRLSPALSQLVRTAAVVGQVVPTWLLEQVSELQIGDDHLRELASLDLLFPDDTTRTLQFKHGITRDVVYNSVGRRERSALHVRIGHLLEQQDPAVRADSSLEALAYHFDAGGDSPGAVRYSALAGDKAFAAASLDRARHHYQVALHHLATDLATDDAARRFTELAQRLAGACVYDPTRQHVAICRQAVTLARRLGDAERIARSEYWLGYVCYGLGELPDALTHIGHATDQCQRAIEQAGPSDELDALRVQIIATLSQVRAAASDYHDLLPQLEMTIEHKRSAGSGGRPIIGLAYTLACRASVLVDMGRFDEGQQCFAEAREMVKGRRSPVEGSILTWQGAAFLWRGQWREAMENGAYVQQIAERTESLYILSMAEAIIGYAKWVLTGDRDTLAAIMRATTWLEDRDKCLGISLNYGWLADAMATVGRVRDTRAYVASALRRARRRDSLGAPMALRALAKAFACRGDSVNAIASLHRALAASRRRQSRHEEAVTSLHVGVEYARTGQQPLARQWLAHASDEFRAMGMLWHDAEAQRHASELSPV